VPLPGAPTLSRRLDQEAEGGHQRRSPVPQGLSSWNGGRLPYHGHHCRGWDLSGIGLFSNEWKDQMHTELRMRIFAPFLQNVSRLPVGPNGIERITTQTIIEIVTDVINMSSVDIARKSFTLQCRLRPSYLCELRE
jgi:hypothetical protein